MRNVVRSYAILSVVLLSSSLLPAPVHGAENEPVTSASSVVIAHSRGWALDGKTEAVTVKGVSAEVSIEDTIATTTLDVDLSNPAKAKPATVDLLVPVPRGAKVRSASMQSAGEALVTRVYRQAKARGAFDAVSRLVGDASPLEFLPYDLVRVRPFEIAARGTARVRVVYAQKLRADGDRLDYLLPRSESLEASEVPWSVTARIRGARKIAAVYSPTHNLQTSRTSPTEANVTVSGAGKLGPGPVLLSYLVSDGAPAASFYTIPDRESGGGHFLMVAGAPEAAVVEERVVRDVTFVVDRSGSMVGGKLAQARDAIVKSVNSLRDGEAFDVVDYAAEVASLGGPVVKGAGDTPGALAYVTRISAAGGTNIHDALVKALGRQPVGGSAPILIFLTDGMASAGVTGESQIRSAVVAANAHKWKIYSVGLGNDVNAPLLTTLSEATGGEATFVAPGEDVGAVLEATLSRVAKPALKDVRLRSEAEGLVSDLLPSGGVDLAHGDQFVALGRYAGSDPIEVVLEGGLGDERVAYPFLLDPSKGSRRYTFVPRLWAARKIASIVAAVTYAGAAPTRGESADAELDAAAATILRLTLDHGVLTEYTVMLVGDGADLSNMERLVAQVRARLASRAQQTRSGAGGISQAINVRAQRGQATLGLANSYVDERRQRVAIRDVLLVGDLTLLRHGQRWIDARLLPLDSKAKADEVIVFGSTDFESLKREIVERGRFGLFAVPGEAMLDRSGKRLLFVRAAEQPQRAKTDSPRLVHEAPPTRPSMPLRSTVSPMTTTVQPTAP